MAVVLARLVVARHPLGDAFHLVEEVAERPLDDKIDRPGGSDQRNLGERGEMGGEGESIAKRRRQWALAEESRLGKHRRWQTQEQASAKVHAGQQKLCCRAPARHNAHRARHEESNANRLGALDRLH